MSETELVLENLIEILLVACVVAIAVKRVHLPYTTALVLMGMGVSFLPVHLEVALSKELVLLIVLPPLLFQGALHMDLASLRRNLLSIATMAFPGLILAALLVGGMLHYILDMPWLKGLLFGAMVAATDPISVLAIFREVGAPERLRMMMEGESLFNDGTSVVLFGSLYGVLYGGREVTVAGVGLEFLKVSVGGAVVGALLGYLTYRIMKGLDDHLLEVTLTIVLVFASLLLAELSHFSGVIAVVVAGLIMGNYGRLFSMSEQTRDTIENFWEVVDFLINALLFLLIGFEMKTYVPDLIRYFAPGVLVILIVLISRGLTVYPVWFLVSKTRQAYPFRWSHVLVWGGLRGSIPIALVLGMPSDIPFRAEFLVFGTFLVFFSLVIQSFTMKPLLRWALSGWSE
ncbi:MAG: Na+/H+ antiporter [Acidobacteriota bacterium]